MATAQFPIVDDLTVERREEFRATLSTTDPIVVLGSDLAAVTILDNDGRKIPLANILYTNAISCIVLKMYIVMIL